MSLGSPLFVAGLWATDFHVGILWIQTGKPKQSEPKRVEGVPSWSWATVPVPVAWKHLEKLSQPKFICQFLGVSLVRATESRENEQEKFYAFPKRKDGEEPIGHAETAASLVDSNHCAQNDHTEAQLKINDRIVDLRLRGKLQKVRFWEDAFVGDEFLFTNHIKAMTAMAELVRYLFAPDKDDIVAGWGVLEGLQLQPPMALDIVWALLVMKERIPYGHTLGFWRPRCDIFHVLFLRETGGSGSNQLERLGAGQLYGVEIEKGFRVTEDKDIILV